MAEPELKRFGNSSQPSTSDLVKTVCKKFSGKTTKEEGNTLKDEVLPEIEKADDINKSEEFSESDNELCGDILQIRDDFDLIETINDDTVTFKETEDKLPRLKKQEDIEPTSKILEEFIGESDVGVKWKENSQSHNCSNQKPYIPADDIVFPDKNAENEDNCSMKVKSQINDEERMELDDSLKGLDEGKASLEPVIVSVAKGNPMSKQIKVCLSNDLFGNVNDIFDIGNVSVGKGNISVGIGNALVGSGNALFDNGIVSVGNGNALFGKGIVSVGNGNASGNCNATVGIQPDDQSNTLPSLNPYKSRPQKPPDPAQYTISPELREALQSNLRLKSEQTRRALQERFHPYKQQKDKSKKFQTSLPILPEFE